MTNTTIGTARVAVMTENGVELAPWCAILPANSAENSEGLNEWFADVFLPSLFDKAGPGGSAWLSEKQVAVCERNMKSIQRMASKNYFSNYLRCWWRGREVVMHYCGEKGKLSFCNTREEKIACEYQNRKRELCEINMNFSNKLKGRTDEWLRAKIKSLSARIVDAKKDYAESLSDFLDGDTNALCAMYFQALEINALTVREYECDAELSTRPVEIGVCAHV